jgi:hypothetical protein
MYHFISEKYGYITSNGILDLVNEYWKVSKKELIKRDIQRSELLKDFNDIMNSKNLIAGEVAVCKKHNFTITYKKEK